MLNLQKDRFGLGWRPELAAGIFANIDKIDLVEVILEDWLAADTNIKNALETLARSVPVALHGVSLGLASADPVDTKRLDAVARLVERVRPEFWSEHLAFVRSRNIEIGHLAAPPRTRATIDGTVKNVARAASIVGARPRLENIATLIDPPFSEYNESEWLTKTAAATGAPLLLDLHNLYANAVNFKFNVREAIAALPLPAITAVHLAGGRSILHKNTGETRILDDHLHDVPDPVFELLEFVGEIAPSPLNIIIERDGRYPPMPQILRELERARKAVARGRARRAEKLASAGVS